MVTWVQNMAISKYEMAIGECKVTLNTRTLDANMKLFYYVDLLGTFIHTKPPKHPCFNNNNMLLYH